MIDRSGQKLDNYRLFNLLGRGSFGEVYLAQHVVRKTRVAIKIFNIDAKQVHDLDGRLLLWQVAIKIFNIDSKQMNQPDISEEIRNLVRLNGHPNIVRIIDFSVKPPAPFIVMDYAPNGTLATKHPRGIPVPLATVMVYVKQIASALQYAHDESLIHRDVKPANILVAQNGTLLLSDFGITIPSQSMLVANIRGYQDFAGTPEYMAPEQIQSRPSRASDQYALAILVYEWLTGYPPFMGNQRDILNKHLSITPAPLPRTVSPEIAAVLMKALSKNPENRYPTIQNFASELEHAYNEVLQGSQTPTLVEKPPLPAMNSKTKEQWVREGRKYGKAKSYNEAVVAYTKAIELAPVYALAYNGRGAAYHNLKQYREAVRDYSKAIELAPAYALAYHNRGLAYYSLERYENAMRDYNKAIELAPAFAAAYRNRGTAHYDLRRHEEAVRDYNKAIELDPAYTAAYYNRGTLYNDLKQYEDALHDYNKALELDPAYALAYHNRGVAYCGLQNYEQAIADYDRALALDPNFTLARENRERTLRILQALQVFKREEEPKKPPSVWQMFGLEE